MRRCHCVVLVYVLLLVTLGNVPQVHGHSTRHKHHRNNETPSTKLNTPPVVCGDMLPEVCNCTRHDRFIDISCYDSGLDEIPELESGSSFIKTLNLSRNQIPEVEVGTFFGVKVEKIILANNNISHLDFLSFWGLEFHLAVLDLSYNIFKHVPFSSLRLLRNLHTLNMDGNSLTRLNNLDFGYLRKLQVLSLNDNPIKSIGANAFRGTELSLLSLNSINLSNGLHSFPSTKLRVLKGLSLAGNNLTDLQAEWFNNLECLCYLNLDSNGLSHLPAAVLAGIGGTLEALELNSNKFTNIPKDLLKTLPKLRTLEMNRNRIGQITAYVFNSSTNLLVLGLRRNVISKISVHGFDGLNKIQRMDLRENRLTILDDRTFYWDDMRGREILMANNPLLCNCQMKWLKREFKRKSDLSRMFSDARSMVCARPYFLTGLPLMRLHLKQLTCDHNYYFYYLDNEDEDEESYSSWGDYYNPYYYYP